MNRFSFRRFGELLLLLAVGIAIGVALDRWLRPTKTAVAYMPVVAPAPAAVAAAPRPRPAAAPASALSCSLEAVFEDNLYPSLLLSLAAADPAYSRCLSVQVHGAIAGRVYQVEIQSSLFYQAAMATVAATGPDAELRPQLPWDFVALRKNTQLRPETMTLTVTAEGAAAQDLITCSVHPVNEAVSRLQDPETGNWIDVSSCFAAYVNEDHPWIGQVLQDAMGRDGLARFSGYEFGAESVVRQIHAIWDALAARGLNYVDMATTSSAVPGVSTQYVRFFDQTLRDQGANCVDASVMFASIFRRIGLRPVLIFRPGHCFVAVYDAPTGGQLMAIETTVLSSAAFGSAFALGSQELASTLPHLDTTGFSSVDIAVARQSGIRPISYEP